MVRLKLVQIGTKYSVTEQSQFHYGSIKTQGKMVYVDRDAKVSIPLWFD